MAGAERKMEVEDCHSRGAEDSGSGGNPWTNLSQLFFFKSKRGNKFHHATRNVPSPEDGAAAVEPSTSNLRQHVSVSREPVLLPVFP